MAIRMTATSMCRIVEARKWRHVESSAALAVAATGLWALLGSACEANCPIGSGLALLVAPRSTPDLPVAQGSYSYQFDGRTYGPHECTYGALEAPPPGVVSCAKIVLLVTSQDAGVLRLDFVGPGLEPYVGEFEVESDGCDVITQSIEIDLQWLPGETLCRPYCSNLVGCEADTPFSSVDECVDACAADIADPVPDRCVPLYRGLYGCLGAVSCEAYLEHRENVPGNACEAHIAAISDCEDSL